MSGNKDLIPGVWDLRGLGSRVWGVAWGPRGRAFTRICRSGSGFRVAGLPATISEAASRQSKRVPKPEITLLPGPSKVSEIIAQKHNKTPRRPLFYILLVFR